jgi:hypothetical protein
MIQRFGIVRDIKHCAIGVTALRREGNKMRDKFVDVCACVCAFAVAAAFICLLTCSSVAAVYGTLRLIGVAP